MPLHQSTRGTTLAERAEISRRSRPDATGNAVESDRVPGDDEHGTAAGLDQMQEQADGHAPGARHCWVTGLGQPGRWPGLLVAWRRQDDGWCGRAVYGVVDDGQTVLIETWVPAQHLHPARP